MYRNREIKNENIANRLTTNHSFGRLRRKSKTNIDLNKLTFDENNNNYKDYQQNNIQQNNRNINLNLNNQNFANDENKSTISNSNSIHTSYKYKKYNTNCNNEYNNKKILMRPCSANKIICNHSNNYSKQVSNGSESEEYLLCQNCINCKLIEEKRKQKNLENYDNNNAIPAIFEDKYRYYNQKVIDDNVRQREQGTNEVLKNLKKYSNNEKDKLILENENCPNPLCSTNHNYSYEKFMDNYNKKQKIFSENLKQFQKPENEIDNYYNLYVNNPKCQTINYGEYKPQNFDPIEYRNFLQNQIKYKNYLKNKEKLEDKQREIKVYENLEQILSRENDERENRKKKLNEEFIKANLELINAKKAMKNKELEEQKMYRDYYNMQNMEYKDQIKKDKQKKDKKNEEFLEENQRQLNRIKRRKDQEILDNENYKYNDNSFEPMKEKMAHCSNCHRLLPRRLLTRTRKSFKLY